MPVRKIISNLMSLLELFCVLTVVYDIFNPGKPYVKPFAFGMIFVFLTIDALVTQKVSTRINLVDKGRNKLVYYLMTVTYLVFAIIILKHAYNLFAK